MQKIWRVDAKAMKTSIHGNKKFWNLTLYEWVTCVYWSVSVVKTTSEYVIMEPYGTLPHGPLNKLCTSSFLKVFRLKLNHWGLAECQMQQKKTTF